MKKHFYTDILNRQAINTVLIELESANLSKKEKEHLESMFYSSIHITIIDVVLSELPDDHKKTFLSHLHSLPHEKVFDFVKEKTQDIETKIFTAVEKIAKEFLQDIKDVKKQ